MVDHSGMMVDHCWYDGRPLWYDGRPLLGPGLRDQLKKIDLLSSASARFMIEWAQLRLAKDRFNFSKPTPWASPFDRKHNLKQMRGEEGVLRFDGINRNAIMFVWNSSWPLMELWHMHETNVYTMSYMCALAFS